MPIVLQLLRIKNLALVEDLEWHLGPGFTAITGETGAGKSIIIGALQLLLGERTDKSLIRTGTEQCVVEAIFAGADLSELNEMLDEAGVEKCNGELLLRRSFSNAGTNRQFINGSPTTLSVLKTLGDELIDLHGPHDHQSLLSPERQLGLLDAFAHAGPALAEFQSVYRKWHALLAEQASLSTAESAREHELDLLRHQVNEISGADLRADEEAEITARYKVAGSSKRLIELASAVALRLCDEENAVVTQLAETQKWMRELEKIDTEIEPLANAHAACITELSEISRTLGRYAEGLELDPSQLAALEERVSLFETLKRKYGGSIPEVIAFGERAAERMRKIEGRDAELERLSVEIGNAHREMKRAGDALTRLRTKAAPKLSEKIRDQLRDLGFRQSEFETKIAHAEEPRATGYETAELLFSPNPGEPMKPLRSIASSGEISRLMLAIKSALAAEDAIPLLVFDEIDANVGGEIANAVGAQMRALAAAHQVLCITHLPQVAAAAQAHFVVSKEVTKGRTVSRLTEVRGRARREEIARMLGGQSESALRHATTLLQD